jgi:hypothetical protein
MKSKIFFLFLVSLICVKTTFAQTDLLKKGNKVFILASDGVTKDIKTHLLKWKYWEVADNRKDADFIMKFYCFRTNLSTYTAAAEFINAQTNETIKMTGSVWSKLSTSDAAEHLLYNQENDTDE